MGCVIRGYHVYKDVWLSHIGEVLYCCRDGIKEACAEGVFGSATAAKQIQNVYFLEILARDIG